VRDPRRPANGISQAFSALLALPADRRTARSTHSLACVARAVTLRDALTQPALTELRSAAARHQSACFAQTKAAPAAAFPCNQRREQPGAARASELARPAACLNMGRNWEPELAISDRPPGSRRPPKPADSDWEPDLVVLDEPPRSARPPDPGIARHAYLSWLESLSSQSAPALRVVRAGFPSSPDRVRRMRSWNSSASCIACSAPLRFAHRAICEIFCPDRSTQRGVVEEPVAKHATSQLPQPDWSTGLCRRRR
jgi:hypothetical protein